MSGDMNCNCGAPAILKASSKGNPYYKCGTGQCKFFQFQNTQGQGYQPMRNQGNQNYNNAPYRPPRSAYPQQQGGYQVDPPQQPPPPPVTPPPLEDNEEVHQLRRFAFDMLQSKLNKQESLIDSLVEEVKQLQSDVECLKNKA